VARGRTCIGRSSSPREAIRAASNFSSGLGGRQDYSDLLVVATRHLCVVVVVEGRRLVAGRAELVLGGLVVGAAVAGGAVCGAGARR
jgi:hypothetical protein